MSDLAQTADEPPIQEIGPDDVADPGGDIYTFSLYSDSQAVSSQPTEADAKTWIGDRLATIRSIQVPAVADDYGQIWDFVQGAWDDGELPYADTNGFFGWLRYNKGVILITSAVLGGGAMAKWLADYARSKGYPVPAAAPPATPVVLPTPTQGTQTTSDIASTLVQRTVTAPGLTAAETKAISTAITVALDDVQKLVSGAIDTMLPNLAPGQVTEALTDLFQAASVLEYQLWALSQSVISDAKGSLAEQLHGLQQTVNGMGEAVNLLYEQVHLTAESPLGDEAGTTATQTQANTTAIDKITSTDLPELGAQIGAVATGLGALNTQVGTQIVPELTTTSALAEQSAAKLALTDDNCLEGLCDAEENVTTPIKQGGATPSLLKSLGGLLGKALEIGFAATIIDALLTVLDAQAAVSAVVSDTETLAGWAESAANVIASDLSWQGQLAS
jgi:hypothetical protein